MNREEREQAWKANFGHLPEHGIPKMPENWWPPEERHKLPSVYQQAWNVTKACGKNIVSGFKRTTDEEYRKRIEICMSCPLRIPESNRCSACGCFVNHKAKMSTESCPEGNWPDI